MCLEGIEEFVPYITKKSVSFALQVKEVCAFEDNVRRKYDFSGFDDCWVCKNMSFLPL